MNLSTKKLFLYITIGITLGFSLLFFSGRSSSASIKKRSFEFIKENEVFIDSVSHFINSNGISGCNNTFLYFYWRKNYVDLACSDTLRNYGKKVLSPSFIKNFFRSNDGHTLALNS